MALRQSGKTSAAVIDGRQPTARTLETELRHTTLIASVSTAVFFSGTVRHVHELAFTPGRRSRGLPVSSPAALRAH